MRKDENTLKKAESEKHADENTKGFLSAFSSLKIRNFRLYFIGQCFSLCGRWIQSIAMSWLVYSLTDSIIMLTTVTFINQIPTLILAPLAGVISDRYDRFKILASTQAMLMLFAFLLSFLVLSGHIAVWHILTISLLSGITSALEAPNRQSFYANLVPPANRANAIALNSVTINAARFVGPSIGGLLISFAGEGYCFMINGLSFIPVFITFAMMQVEPHKRVRESSNMLASFRDGFHYVRSSLPLRAVILCLASISFFGLPFLSITAAFVRENLSGDSTILGYVNSSIGAGAVTAAFYLASRRSIKGLGKILTITGLMLGVSLFAISFTSLNLVAYLLAYPIGCALIGTLATSNTLLQSLVDDDKRGRVMSFYTMASAGITPLGGLFCGWFAEQTSLETMLITSGIICIATGITYESYRPKVRSFIHNQVPINGTQVSDPVGGISENPFE